MDFNKKIQPLKNYKLLELINSDDYYSVVSRKTALLMRSCFPLGYSDKELYKEFFGFPSPHKPFYDSQGGINNSKQAVRNELREILKRWSEDRDYLNKIAAQCIKEANDLLSFSQIIKNKPLSNQTDDNISKLAEESFIKLIRISAYLMLPLSVQKYLEDILKEEIVSRSKDNKLNKKYFSALTTPIENNYGYYEQLSIMKLAIMYEQAGKITNEILLMIEKYLKDHDFIGVKYGIGQHWTKEDIIERIKFLAEQNPNHKHKRMLQLSERQHKDVKKTYNELQAEEKFKELVQTIRTYVYLRTHRTDVISRAFADMFPLWKEVAKRNNVELSDILECLPHEVINFNIPDKKYLTKRSQKIILHARNGILYYTHEYNNNILFEKKDKNKKELKTKTIKGTIANKGKIKGIVKIVLDNSQLNKVKIGDILVTSMTTPDFVPAMERSAAFVTDEGGILCHAAIISREMNKPCIIGTGNASKLLKDGDEVEVDALNGVVKKCHNIKNSHVPHS